MKTFTYNRIAGDTAGSGSRRSGRICRTVVGFVLLAVLLLYGCTKDPQNNPTHLGDGKVTFTLEVPGLNALAVKSLDELEESYIHSLDLFLFEDMSGSELLAGHYVIDPADIANHTDQPYKTFFVQGLPVSSTRQFRIVLLANASAYLTGAELNVGTTDKKTFLNSLDLFDIATNWDASTNTYLPMWGESADRVTFTSSQTVVPTIQLLRSVAKLDIKLSDEAQKKFELHQIAIYYVNDKGQIAPEADKFSHITRRVSGVSVPDEANAPFGPHLFQAASSHDAAPAIFLPEYDPADESDETKRYRFLVEGRYLVDNPSNPDLTWYEFYLDDSDTGDPLPLLRNFIYEVTINDVKDAGYRTPNELFNDNVAILSADVVPWDVSQTNEYLGNIIFKVSKTDFHFNADGRVGYFYNDVNVDDSKIWGPTYRDHLIDIYTNHPTGFTIAKIVDEHGTELKGNTSWLTIEKGMGYWDVSNSYTYNPDQYYLKTKGNVGLHSRTATVYLKSGTKQVQLSVTQDYLPDCGHEGEFETETLWNVSYDTHIYSGEQNGLTRCWMVDNLQNTDPVYNDNTDYVLPGTYGNYFRLSHLIDNSYSPCPTGWHLPRSHEAASLMHALNPTLNIDENIPLEEWEVLPIERKRWFEKEKFAGFYMNGNPLIQSEGSLMYLALISETLQEGGIVNLVLDYMGNGWDVYRVWFSVMPTDYYVSVRCVKDLPTGF